MPNHNSSPTLAVTTPAGDIQQGKASNQRYVLVGILLFTLLVAYLDRVNVGILVADRGFLDAMGIRGNPVQMGMLMTLFLIAYGVSNAALSPLGDILGPRKAMCLSIFLWALSMVIGGITAVFGTMLLSRVILGLGEGMHWPMQSKYVKNWFPPRERGKANAIWLAGIFIGPALAMPFFTWLIGSYGWRCSFFVLAALGMVPMVLLWFYTTDHPYQNKRVNQAERDYIQAGMAAENEAEARLSKVSIWDNTKEFIFIGRATAACRRARSSRTCMAGSST